MRSLVLRKKTRKAGLQQTSAVAAARASQSEGPQHAELTEAAALQARLAEQHVQQQTETQKTRQVLWQAASSLRGLGADPRIEAAIAALGSLFKGVDIGNGADHPVQQP